MDAKLGTGTKEAGRARDRTSADRRAASEDHSRESGVGGLTKGVEGTRLPPPAALSYSPSSRSTASRAA
jgi:hypothetical protein